MSTSNDILHEYLQVSRHLTERFRATYGSLNLTYPQSIVLAILEADGPMPISALSEAAGSANSTISGVVDRLERMNLVKRVRSETDRRVIYVTTTEHFRSRLSEVKDSASDRFSAAISSLTQEELDRVSDGLSLLNRTLQAQA